MYWCRIVGPSAQFFCIWIISRFRWETYDYINQFVLKAQLLYLRKTWECTRKKLVKVCSFKNFLTKVFEDALTSIIFPTLKTHRCYLVIDKVAPIKESRIKDNLQECFNDEICGAIKNWDKLFRILKKFRLSIDKI